MPTALFGYSYIFNVIYAAKQGRDSIYPALDFTDPMRPLIFMGGYGAGWMFLNFLTFKFLMWCTVSEKKMKKIN